MSKTSEKFFSNPVKSTGKPIRTPPKSELLRKTQKSMDINKKTQDRNFQDIVTHEKDQRFRYLIKHGQLKKIEKGGNIIFAELQQIHNVWICYRRPNEREAHLEKLTLDGLELNHIPLLEGEEKLKMLTFQGNFVHKLENIVSLPSLIYLDLSCNQIRELENLGNVPLLKVLLLSKNEISIIKNINELPMLEVLDLHSNKLSKIEGLKCNHNLRILNLSHNQIQRIENIQHLTSIIELNLKANAISLIENVGCLNNCEKMYLANNRIEIKSYKTSELTKLGALKELTLDNNPCTKDRASYIRNLIKLLPKLKLLDGKTPAFIDESPDNSEQSNQDEVLALIQKQWEQEQNRIKDIESVNGPKREYLKSTCITGGHAQIEDESILFIYGNSYDVVLSNPTFQENVEKIQFKYIFIEFIIEQSVIATLKKFKKLKILEFSNNYIGSLLQIAKLENLSNLRSITFLANPITTCTFLKEFVIYRFPTVLQINKEDVKENDRVKAKMLFQHFDKILQIPEKVFGAQQLKNYNCQKANAKKDRTYLKNYHRILSDASQIIAQAAYHKAQQIFITKQQLGHLFDSAMLQLINIQRRKHQP